MKVEFKKVQSGSVKLVITPEYGTEVATCTLFELHNRGREDCDEGAIYNMDFDYEYAESQGLDSKE